MVCAGPLLGFTLHPLKYYTGGNSNNAQRSGSELLEVSEIVREVVYAEGDAHAQVKVKPICG